MLRAAPLLLLLQASYIPIASSKAVPLFAVRNASHGAAHIFSPFHSNKLATITLLSLRRAVLDELRDEAATPIPLRAVRLLAAYHSGAREAALSAAEAALSDAHAAADTTLQTVAAHMYIAEGNYNAALKVLRSPHGLEQLALLVQLHLRIDRADLAEKSLQAMKAVDDEAALYTLSAAQLCMVQGGPRIREAHALYRELNDRFGGSVAGVNGLAAVYIAQQKYSDAERLLVELLESHPGQPDALINLITVYTHMGRADDVNKALDQLRAAAPRHPYLQQAEMLEATFDRVAASFAPAADAATA